MVFTPAKEIEITTSSLHEMSGIMRLFREDLAIIAAP